MLSNRIYQFVGLIWIGLTTVHINAHPHPNPHNPHNPFNPFNPFNPHNPNNPHNPHNPFNPFNPFNPHNPNTNIQCTTSDFFEAGSTIVRRGGRDLIDCSRELSFDASDIRNLLLRAIPLCFKEPCRRLITRLAFEPLPQCQFEVAFGYRFSFSAAIQQLNNHCHQSPGHHHSGNYSIKKPLLTIFLVFTILNTIWLFFNESQ